MSIQNHGCDAGVRLSLARKNPGERGKRKRLSSYQSIEVWQKPKQRPKALSPEEFASLPAELTVRVIKYYIPNPGFRSKYVVLATTLLDTLVYPTTEIR